MIRDETILKCKTEKRGIHAVSPEENKGGYVGKDLQKIKVLSRE